MRSATIRSCVVISGTPSIVRPEKNCTSGASQGQDDVVDPGRQDVSADLLGALLGGAGHRQLLGHLVGTRDNNFAGRLFGHSVSESVSHKAHTDVTILH
jgi:hypothetical protein